MWGNYFGLVLSVLFHQFLIDSLHESTYYRFVGICIPVLCQQQEAQSFQLGRSNGTTFCQLLNSNHVRQSIKMWHWSHVENCSSRRSSTCPL
jgi:hypothetical protein